MLSSLSDKLKTFSQSDLQKNYRSIIWEKKTLRRSSKKFHSRFISFVSKRFLQTFFLNLNFFYREWENFFISAEKHKKHRKTEILTEIGFSRIQTFGKFDKTGSDDYLILNKSLKKVKKDLLLVFRFALLQDFAIKPWSPNGGGGIAQRSRFAPNSHRFDSPVLQRTLEVASKLIWYRPDLIPEYVHPAELASRMPI